MNWLSELFKDHGTKLIGGALSVAGGAIAAVATISPETAVAIGGPKFAGAVLLAGGAMTVWRGIKNTQAQNQPPA